MPGADFRVMSLASMNDYERNPRMAKTRAMVAGPGGQVASILPHEPHAHPARIGISARIPATIAVIPASGT
ncbi:hypothetical protein [Bradyrhizobium sp.]|uniref:hypothetical protein n=1 Tax=Bradyrhizobium sp. TaxID=376 RepID=UPI003C60898C